MLYPFRNLSFKFCHAILSCSNLSTLVVQIIQDCMKIFISLLSYNNPSQISWWGGLSISNVSDVIMICSIIKKIQLFLTKMEELNLTSIERIDTAPPFQSKVHISISHYKCSTINAHFLVFFSILNRLRIEKKTKNIH